MTMLQYHSVKEMYTSFGDVYITDGTGTKWEFRLRECIGMRKRNGAVEIEFAGGFMDHRFIISPEDKEQSK